MTSSCSTKTSGLPPIVHLIRDLFSASFHFFRGSALASIGYQLTGEDPLPLLRAVTPRTRRQLGSPRGRRARGTWATPLIFTHKTLRLGVALFENSRRLANSAQVSRPRRGPCISGLTPSSARLAPASTLDYSRRLACSAQSSRPPQSPASPGLPQALSDLCRRLLSATLG